MNLGPLLPFEFVPILFAMVSKWIPDAIEIFFTQALNKRLEVEGKSIQELSAIAAKRSMTLTDVISIPE